MLLPMLACLIGLILLVWSADRFVAAASAVAAHWGVPLLLIGLLVMGFGTSAPEMLVAAQATLTGASGLALGNVVGSNIANLGLILGVTLLVTPITLNRQQENISLWWFLSATLVVCLMMWLGRALVVWHGLLLVLLFFGFIGQSYWQMRRHSREVLASVAEQLPDMGAAKAVAGLIFSLLLLLFSARLLVWGGVEVAQYLGVSDLIIGLTLVAIGTSLPELAASVAAALKRQTGLVMGNLLGSNLFNLLAVLPITPLLAGQVALPNALLMRDLPVMLLLTLSLFLLTRYRLVLSRWVGGFLLSGFVFWQLGVLLFFQA